VLLTNGVRFSQLKAILNQVQNDMVAKKRPDQEALLLSEQFLHGFNNVVFSNDFSVFADACFNFGSTTLKAA
jgi:hypothetical protein